MYCITFYGSVLFKDDLKAFGINADLWTTEPRGMAQDSGTRGGTFQAKWVAAAEARAGLRHAVVRPNVTGRTKERIVQSKRVRAGSLALVD